MVGEGVRAGVAVAVGAASMGLGTGVASVVQLRDEENTTIPTINPRVFNVIQAT
jgi:hypothetical protein